MPRVSLLLLAVCASAHAAPAFDRDDWRHWIDADGDCQNARQELLIRRSIISVTFTDRQDGRDCTVRTGDRRRNRGAFRECDTTEGGPDGELRLDWSGEIPMRWRYQEAYPVLRTLGPTLECDLCSIVRGKWLELLPLFQPSEVQVRWTSETRQILSFEARSVEADSRPFSVELSWDGKWEDGMREMRDHFVVKEYVLNRTRR